MKTLLLIIALPLVGCASKPHCCVLKFDHKPSDKLIAALAYTQPNTTPSEVSAWFDGHTGFVLATTHTNEIALAVAEGAQVKGIK